VEFKALPTSASNYLTHHLAGWPGVLVLPTYLRIPPKVTTTARMGS
jgi:hypothetical protein